ncbi:uncharacterized protein LOC131169239 isoform X1 [Hevea brasiliensis]|uniref:uncharacterized protein LOC131169239 isoform X1 n=1 Tax=Hevea brasiliensis TaxID=3981 RepID=UPI0025E8B14F|nr:uncharacterized protein LOC131169239 isoform X1 [Hevea brasiliensis]XP_057997867.1 uncharacterized protein LOC131169239 isoform X1 [Hevea brasiliensis]XP_057997868.1 uncharacterized protein LOC131169239 isoform X1 [Hevea brasiliensis]
MTVLSCQEMPQKSHCEVVSLVQESICFAMLITSTCLNMNSIWTQLQFTLQRKPCGHNSDANMVLISLLFSKYVNLTALNEHGDILSGGLICFSNRHINNTNIAQSFTNAFWKLGKDELGYCVFLLCGEREAYAHPSIIANLAFANSCNYSLSLTRQVHPVFSSLNFVSYHPTYSNR